MRAGSLLGAWHDFPFCLVVTWSCVLHGWHVGRVQCHAFSCHSYCVAVAVPLWWKALLHDVNIAGAQACGTM